MQASEDRRVQIYSRDLRLYRAYVFPCLPNGQKLRSQLPLLAKRIVEASFPISWQGFRLVHNRDRHDSYLMDWLSIQSIDIAFKNFQRIIKIKT